ncbi:MAG: hypothetical protein H6621_13200 [Halobacteriovoraceae bacterium]|nr:hypothetical protein [Halobacteriovoraceae bacterium]
MRKLPTIILIAFFCQMAFSQKDENQLSSSEKQMLKEQSRWTLADWISTKRRMQLMDQWALLSEQATPIELYLEGALGSLKNDSDEFYMEKTHQIFSAGFFIYFLGFEYNTINMGEGSNISYLASFRLLGSSLQTTNLYCPMEEMFEKMHCMGICEQISCK